MSSTRCISSAIDDSLAPLTLLPSVLSCSSEFNAAFGGVVTHTDTMIVFVVPAGVGKGLNLTVSAVSPDGTAVSSGPRTFSYTAPTLDRTDPTTWLVTPPVAASATTYVFSPSKLLTFYGSNFGPYGQEASWSPQERQVSITIDGYACPGALRKFVDNSVVLQCEYARDASAALGVPVSDPSVPRAGIKDVRAFVAGQESFPAPTIFRVGCSPDSYGQPGDICLPCPLGAECDGYRGDLASPSVALIASNVLKYGPLVFLNRSTSWGFNVTQCHSCHTRPRALPGFFNMRGLVNKEGESETICDPIRKAEGRAAVECENVVACEPPESCLSDNVCADGYTNDKGWPYRCAACADGFFRSSGICRRCPNNPELNILFFFIVAIAAIACGWLLNQKQVNIAFLTIGLDYMQVISIFAATRVAWPQQIQDLFRILSAFNLNIEIMAPECVFKGLQYTQKWGMIMALPLGVFALLLCVHGANIFYAVFIRGQKLSTFAAEAASPLIAMAQVLMYFLYLYLTRSRL
jgi:hypothetical protein